MKIMYKSTKQRQDNEKISLNIMSLPISAFLTSEEQEYIAVVVNLDMGF